MKSCCDLPVYTNDNEVGLGDTTTCLGPAKLLISIQYIAMTVSTIAFQTSWLVHCYFENYLAKNTSKRLASAFFQELNFNTCYML